MSSEQIKKTRERVRAKLAKLNKRENTDDVLELTLEELTAISGGVSSEEQESVPWKLPFMWPCGCHGRCG